MKLLVLLCTSFCFSVFAQEPPAVEDSTIYEFPDVQPEFPGGPMELSSYLIHNFVEDDACDYNHYNKIYLSFVVELDGQLTDVKCMYDRNVNACFTNEIIRIFEGMPAWNPGEFAGKAVRTRVHHPVIMTFN